MQSNYIKWLLSGMLATCLLLESMASAAHVPNPLSFVFDDGIGIPQPYRLFLPPNHDQLGATFPLVLYLHSGGRGGVGNDFSLSPIDGLVDASQSDRFASFVLVPQAPADRGWTYSGDAAFPSSLDITEKIIAQLEMQYAIDPQRRYVTGFSAGGFGSWTFITAQPELFDAAIPMAGGGSPSQADRIKDVRTWVFHGRNDDIVLPDAAREMIVALRQAGGAPLYTETTGGHGVFDNRGRYDDPSNEIFPWLFEGVQPALASLIYNQRDGNVRLDARSAPGGRIDVFRLNSEGAFSIPETMVVDGVTRNTEEFLFSADENILLYNKPSADALRGMIDLGNVLPPNLDFRTLSNALTFQAYRSPVTGSELRYFQVFVENVPEPSPLALLLVGLTCVACWRGLNLVGGKLRETAEASNRRANRVATYEAMRFPLSHRATTC